MMKVWGFKRRNVIKRFGQWAVTSFGVENLYGPCDYDIDRRALGHSWWSDHMREKNWVVSTDFDAALAFARRHFGIEVREREGAMA